MEKFLILPLIPTIPPIYGQIDNEFLICMKFIFENECIYSQSYSSMLSF